MHSFPVPVLSFAVCFLSPFPDSLPQLFLRCLLPAFAFRIFRFPSTLFRLLLFCFRLLSPLFLPFRSSRFCLTVASTVPLLRFPFLGFPHSFLPDFSCILSWFSYSDLCLFPFVLPCFAPTAVPQVLPFQISPPGSTPDFRFLSSASIVASHYSAYLSFLFHLSSRLRRTTGYPGASVPLTLPRFSPLLPAWFPMPSFRFCVLGFLFVSFRSSLIRSHSCSSGASLSDLSSGIDAWLPLPFVRFHCSIPLLGLCFFLSLFSVSPSQLVPRYTPVPFVPGLSPSVPPVSMLPFRLRYSAFLLFFPPLYCFASQALPTAAGLLFPARPFPLAFALGSGYSARPFGHLSFPHRTCIY